jgi:hypothetical protein
MFMGFLVRQDERMCKEAAVDAANSGNYPLDTRWPE